MPSNQALVSFLKAHRSNLQLRIVAEPEATRISLILIEGGDYSRQQLTELANVARKMISDALRLPVEDYEPCATSRQFREGTAV